MKLIIRGSACLLGEKVTLLVDVTSIDEDLAIDGLELVGAWPELLHDDTQSFLWRGEPMAFLAYLAERRRAMSCASSSWVPSYAPPY